MKKKIILITLILSLFIISSLIGILFSKKVIGNSQDIDYTFDNDYFLQDFSYDNFTETIFSSDKFNNRNLTTYNSHYNATYSFENEISNRIIPNEWINSSTGGYIEIIDNYIGHNKVIKMNDVWVGQVSFYQSLSDISYGSIEYWFLNDDMTNGYPVIYLFHGSNELFRIYLTENLVKAYNGFFQDCGYAKENAWTHIKIEYECTLGNYKGLDQYEFNVFNGNIKYGSFSFINNEIHIDKIEFVGISTSLSNNYYLDSLGYSWDDNYTIGQNIIPYLEIDTTIKEVDKYEFAFESFDNLYDLGSDIFSNWSEIDATYDYVNIANDPNDYDRRIQIENDAINYQDSGIEKEFYINSGIINVSWSVNFTDMPLIPAKFCTKIYSSDDTLISYIYIQSGFLKYDFGSIIQLDDGLTTNVVYEFNLYINYWDNISILIYYADCIYQDTFPIELPNITNKDGLGKVQIFYECTIEDLWYIYIDYVGIYINGSSISEEFAYVRSESFYIDPYNYYTWNLNSYSQFNVFITNTNCSFYATSDTFIHGLGNEAQLIPIDLYNGNNIFSVYDITPTNFAYPTLWIQYFGQFNTANLNIEISGIRLKEGVNSYSMDLSYQNVSIQDNFFYVDTSNRLHFTHTANDNDTLEYIQAKFIIDNVYGINRSINFKSYFLGISKAYLINNYVSETTTIFKFPIGSNSINHILPQEQIIKNFVILITDNDDNNCYGNSEGYITSIKLIYYTDIELTLLTLSLIDIMIPLIIILIPTIAIASVYGKKTILPMLMFMSIISFATNLIPIEIFFIIIIALGCGIFLQYRKPEV